VHVLQIMMSILWFILAVCVLIFYQNLPVLQERLTVEEQVDSDKTKTQQSVESKEAEPNGVAGGVGHEVDKETLASEMGNENYHTESSSPTSGDRMWNWTFLYDGSYVVLCSLHCPGNTNVGKHFLRLCNIRV
jgi:hypothetical protein